MTPSRIFSPPIRSIRSRAPLRLGPAGDGTDVSPFCDEHGGAVLNCTIDRYAFAASLGLYDIARLAYLIERSDLALLGGRQDQYAAAFGGVNFIEFLPGERAVVNPLRIEPAILNELEAALAVCFVGVSRESASIVRQQRDNLASHASDALAGMMDLKAAALVVSQFEI